MRQWQQEQGEEQPAGGCVANTPLGKILSPLASMQSQSSSRKQSGQSASSSRKKNNFDFDQIITNCYAYLLSGGFDEDDEYGDLHFDRIKIDVDREMRSFLKRWRKIE
jgi:hypothetical protein